MLTFVGSMPEWTLEHLGWRTAFERERAQHALDGTIGRIAVEYGGLYRVLIPRTDGIDDVNAALPGRWRYADPLDIPAVGDWVTLRQSGDGFAIDHLFSRRTRFLRQAAGRRAVPQVVGANIDVVFVVTSLDDDFNPRRVERYLAAVLDGGADPVVILSKADLEDSPERAQSELAGVAEDVPVEVVSAREGRGLDRIRAHLGRGRTGALTGSSGVGKSTIVNALVGRPAQRTSAVREADGKGRHTTTHRELILLGPSDGILVDTPGMRELALWTPGDGVERAFEDVLSWAAECRFRDCRHAGEPGCAVLAAVERGALSQARKDSFLKLRAEEQQTSARAQSQRPRRASMSRTSGRRRRP